MFFIFEDPTVGIRLDTPPPIGACTNAAQPKEDKPHSPAPEHSSKGEKAPPTVNYIPLQQIAISHGGDHDPSYSLWGLDIKGRVWRLMGDTWVFGRGPKASDLPPGW